MEPPLRRNGKFAIRKLWRQSDSNEPPPGMGAAFYFEGLVFLEVKCDWLPLRIGAAAASFASATATSSARSQTA